MSVGCAVTPNTRYASSLITARRPSRVMARTPLRIPVTICLKKASSTPTAVAGRPVLDERPSGDVTSNPENRGVRALVTNDNVGHWASDVPGPNVQICGQISRFSSRAVVHVGSRDYDYVSLSRFR